MGAISPVPFADGVFMQKIEERIVKPTIEGLKKDNLPYKGFIFIGLIKVDNEPMVMNTMFVWVTQKQKRSTKNQIRSTGIIPSCWRRKLPKKHLNWIHVLQQQ